MLLICTYILLHPLPSGQKAYSDTANYLNRYENVVAGTWAAGHIGYYSANPVVNLEGLVASPDILELNRDDKIDLYILENINLIITNFNPFGENSSRWFLDLRIDPLLRIQDNLMLTKTIKGVNEDYAMYIFEVNN